MPCLTRCSPSSIPLSNSLRSCGGVPMANDGNRVLFDTNAWMYYFFGSGAQGSDVLSLVDCCIENGCDILYAPTTVKDLFYLIPRYFRRLPAGEKISTASGRAVAWGVIDALMEIATAAPVAVGECELARMLRSKHPDFEDNLMLAAAERGGARFVVTYDEQLLRRFPGVCVTAGAAEQALSLSSYGSC